MKFWEISVELSGGALLATIDFALVSELLICKLESSVELLDEDGLPFATL